MKIQIEVYNDKRDAILDIEASGNRDDLEKLESLIRKHYGYENVGLGVLHQ